MRTTRVDSNQLPQIVEQQISQQTGGRVHRLQVEIDNDKVVIHGQTSTYYVKQLALQAALQVLGKDRTSNVELDIQVGTGKPAVQPWQR